jgi:hypothetical protein
MDKRRPRTKTLRLDTQQICGLDCGPLEPDRTMFDSFSLLKIRIQDLKIVHFALQRVTQLPCIFAGLVTHVMLWYLV